MLTRAEGHEADGTIRTTERCCLDEYWNGSSCVVSAKVSNSRRRTDWAVCVDTSPQPTAIPAEYSPAPGVGGNLDYVEAIRNDYRDAKEPVVAVVSLCRQHWHFEQGAAKVTVGRLGHLAARPAYRGRKGMMRGLFDMIHACVDLACAS